MQRSQNRSPHRSPLCLIAVQRIFSCIVERRHWWQNVGSSASSRKELGSMNEVSDVARSVALPLPLPLPFPEPWPLPTPFAFFAGRESSEVSVS